MIQVLQNINTTNISGKLRKFVFLELTHLHSVTVFAFLCTETWILGYRLLCENVW